jgi:hypothetical protein
MPRVNGPRPDDLMTAARARQRLLRAVTLDGVHGRRLPIAERVLCRRTAVTAYRDLRALGLERDARTILGLSRTTWLDGEQVQS